MTNEIKPYHLLVVEDNPGDFVLLQQYLRLSLLPIEKLHLADSMAAASVLAKENVFDVVLLDLSLPDSMGVNSVITLNQLLPRTPIVVFSGLSTIDIAIESISLGAQDYLVKGEFDEKLLTKALHYSIERKRTLENLRESNERYAFVNKATQDTIWEWNYITREGHWGEGFINTFGYAKDKLIYGKNWMNEYVHPYDKEDVGRSLRTCIESGLENWQNEYRFLCADGTYKFVYDRGFILYDEHGKPYRMIGAMTDVTEKKRLEKELAKQQIKQQKIITEITIQAQEKERNELGRELHDNINQILATVKMYLGLAKSGVDIPEDLVGKSYEYVNAAMEEIRKLSHSLVAPSLGDMGLYEALKELTDGINIGNNIQVQLIYEINDNNFLDNKTELMLYRIVQEQLNNIIKYSRARNAVIGFKKDGSSLYLTISDNGVGFDTSQVVKGIGLKNILSRVEFYSGNMNIISAPGQGCTLEIVFPINNEIEPS